ncbi:MAG TPA: TonB-dependent receptor, partial [Rudaea sp.]
TTGDGVPTYIYDLDSQALVQPQYIYLPEELGNAADGTVVEHSYVFNLGVRGTFGSSNWNYDASFHRSWYGADSTQRLPLTNAVNNFFLGTQDGTDPYGYGYPAYHLRQSHFWGQVTPQQYLTYTDIDRSDSTTYTQQGNITITNTDLFSLPAGSVGFAGLAEIGNQSWDNPVDPRVTAGDFWGRGGTSGNGKRDRQAVAGEFNIPIFSMLTADAAVRYDNYKPDGGSSQDKVTYKLGLEFRPIETLLLRANYGTAFRAPDMGYVFSNGSSFFTTVQDTYNCRKAQGDQFGQCEPPNDRVQIKGFNNGNRDLKYVTAKSGGFGFVYSPLSNLSFKADFYHIKISNEVASYSLQTILDKEADCLLGHTQSGTPVDPTSPSCVQFISQVGRNPANAPINAGALNTVSTFPINIADETVSGITANAQYRLDAGRWGDFTFQADYNTTLKHEYRQFPDDPITDLLRENQYYDQFKDIGSASINWKIGPWSTTVYGIRYGKTWSFDGSYTVAPWMLYNATVQYNLNDDAAISLIGNNIFNSRPPYDRTFTSYPYYNYFNYNSYGRFVAVQFNVHFGGGKHD